MELVRPFWTYSILFYSIVYTTGRAAAAVLLPGGAGAALLDLFYSILFYSILFYSILFYSILFYSILYATGRAAAAVLLPGGAVLRPSGPILFYSILYTTGRAAAAVLLPGGAGAALLDLFYSVSPRADLEIINS